MRATVNLQNPYINKKKTNKGHRRHFSIQGEEKLIKKEN